MIQYNELDMYDTEIKTYGKSYGDHVFNLQKNSKGIMVVKCKDCSIARLYIMGHNIHHCKVNCNGQCKVQELKEMNVSTSKEIVIR